MTKKLKKKINNKSVFIKIFGKFVTTSFKKEETLDDLVSKITPQNRYKETYWGPPVGNEI